MPTWDHKRRKLKLLWNVELAELRQKLKAAGKFSPWKLLTVAERQHGEVLQGPTRTCDT